MRHFSNDKIPNSTHNISHGKFSLEGGRGEQVFTLRNINQWQGSEAVLNSSQVGVSSDGGYL